MFISSQHHTLIEIPLFYDTRGWEKQGFMIIKCNGLCLNHLWSGSFTALSFLFLLSVSLLSFVFPCNSLCAGCLWHFYLPFLFISYINFKDGWWKKFPSSLAAFDYIFWWCYKRHMVTDSRTFIFTHRSNV